MSAALSRRRTRFSFRNSVRFAAENTNRALVFVHFLSFIRRSARAITRRLYRGRVVPARTDGVRSVFVRGGKPVRARRSHRAGSAEKSPGGGGRPFTETAFYYLRNAHRPATCSARGDQLFFVPRSSGPSSPVARAVRPVVPQSRTRVFLARRRRLPLTTRPPLTPSNPSPPLPPSETDAVMPADHDTGYRTGR